MTQRTLDKWPGRPGIHVIAEQLGIPAATLAGLRDGTLVAVPKKDLTSLAKNTGCVDACPCWRRLRDKADFMLAAAQEAGR